MKKYLKNLCKRQKQKTFKTCEKAFYYRMHWHGNRKDLKLVDEAPSSASVTAIPSPGKNASDQTLIKIPMNNFIYNDLFWHHEDQLSSLKLSS